MKTSHAPFRGVVVWRNGIVRKVLTTKLIKLEIKTIELSKEGFNLLDGRVSKKLKAITIPIHQYLNKNYVDLASELFYKIHKDKL